MNQPKQPSISVALAVFPILKSYTRDTPTHINTPSWLLNKKNALEISSKSSIIVSILINQKDSTMHYYHSQAIIYYYSQPPFNDT